jgi:hypothetical protein
MIGISCNTLRISALGERFVVELYTDAAPGLCFLLHSLGVDWMMAARHFRRRPLILAVSTLGFFISSFSAVLASEFTGPVVSILDGDTIEVLRTQRPERIRLSGIDCPERGQAVHAAWPNPMHNRAARGVMVAPPLGEMVNEVTQAARGA